MSRSAVLKPFIDKQDYMNDRIEHGIEQNRKGFAYLHFKKSDGTPISNVHITANQRSHDFMYGANIFMLEEFSSCEQNEAYKNYFSTTFNLATLPFYWRDIEPEDRQSRYGKDSTRIYRRPSPDLCLEFCEKHGIKPKGHCLNYSAFTPEWAKGSVAKEKALLDRHFKEIANRYSQRIHDWEVTNETFWGWQNPSQSNFYNEPDFVEWSFHTAQRYFPTNRLHINEAHIRIWDNASFFGTRSLYWQQIERALAAGARIDAIGMQYHMFYRFEEEATQTAVLYDPERIFAVLDCYGKFGIPIQITELTIPAYSYGPEDEEVQAEIIKNIYSMWFSHPAMEAIIYWNLVDGFAAWAPQGDMEAGENYYHGGLIRYDFTPKPSFKLIKELFEKTWRTNVSIDSHNSNQIIFKGFYGEYELQVAVGENKWCKRIHIEKGRQNHFDIILD